VNVFWHHDVSSDNKLVADAHGLQRPLEELAGFFGSKVRSPFVTAESEEVEVAG
jgi:hypothetical protein